MSRVDEPHEPVPVEAEFPQTREVMKLRLAHLAAELRDRVDEPAAPTSLPREDQVALRLLGHVAPVLALFQFDDLLRRAGRECRGDSEDEENERPSRRRRRS